jgi:hypothetical protein
MWKYLERALEAEPYDILRSALAISEALYFCYFYGAPDSRPGVLTAVEKLTHATIDNANRPRRHWVYPATIRYRTSPGEREFLNAAWQVMGLERTSRRWWQPAAPDESMVVPGELIDLAKQRRGEGSLFAAALSENYLDSDIWNMMGTCAMLHRDDLGTPVAASMASSFYLPAVRFAARAPAARLKYQYNYLHSRAVEYEAVGDDAGDFLVSAVRFLSSAVAQFFHYRDERAEPLWKLIKRDWSRLSPATRAELRRLIITRKWIQNNLPDVVALQ